VIASSLVASLALLLATESGVAAPAPKAEILGLWKGASICTKVEVNEFCHDETVVLNFVDVPDQPATVALKAARIIDGALVRTYDLFFTYEPDTKQWRCEFDQVKVHAVWTYVVSEDGLTGTAALLPEGTIVRNLTAKRTTKDQALAR
jgi:hypothetical protein